MGVGDGGRGVIVVEPLSHANVRNVGFGKAHIHTHTHTNTHTHTHTHTHRVSFLI